MAGYIEGKDELLKRLRRNEGQVRGLQKSRVTVTSTAKLPTDAVAQTVEEAGYDLAGASQ